MKLQALYSIYGKRGKKCFCVEVRKVTKNEERKGQFKDSSLLRGGAEAGLLQPSGSTVYI